MIVSKYFEYKKDESKFKKFLDRKAEKLDKERVNEGLSNNEGQSISESKWCTWVSERGRERKRENNKKKRNNNEGI